MNLVTITWWIFAVWAVISALLCISRRNPIASVLWLVSCMFALAGIYVLLNAEFIAAVQVLVYAGAVMVLFLFVIMLLNLDVSATDVRGSLSIGGAVAVTGLLVVEPAGDDAPDTAVILNADGTQRAKVKNPEARDGAICFGDAYYVEDELTLIIYFSSWQMACVIDEEGIVVRTYETR